MGASENWRETPGGSFQVFLDSVENGEVFHCVECPDRGLSLKSVSPSVNRANQGLTLLIAVVLSPYALSDVADF